MNYPSFLTPLLDAITHLCYPTYCRSCLTLITSENITCPPCAEKLRPISSSTIALTPKTHMTVLAAGNYEEPLRSFILQKHKGVDIKAYEQLAHLILQQTPLAHMSFDYVIPIPLHWTRYAERGYNQAEKMAHTLAKQLGSTYLPLLCRFRRTKFQSHLPVKEREENVAKAFGISWRYRKKAHLILQQKRILLVDDLCTTGATLKSAGKTLLQYGPLSLTAAVACRRI